jgi:hypothetical protein
MNKVTLKFKSAKLLWEFKQRIDSTEVEVDLKLCTITCGCSEAEIALAVEKYGASLVIVPTQ